MRESFGSDSLPRKCRLFLTQGPHGLGSFLKSARMELVPHKTRSTSRANPVTSGAMRRLDKCCSMAKDPLWDIHPKTELASVEIVLTAWTNLSF
jgi:hypothetical protein